MINKDMDNLLVKRLIDIALEEDIATGDITTESCIEQDHHSKAILLAKQNLVFCGKEIFEEIFKSLDPNIKIEFFHNDGDNISAGTEIAKLSGLTHAILKAERTALNFVQRLSGVSTNTRSFVNLLKNGTKVVDTRKTTPGWRALEKYAVKVGGGQNHRFGLYDAVLIKNNHIDANQDSVDQGSAESNVEKSIKKCIENSKARNKNIFIQVEVRDQKELEIAMKANPSSILLDNMSVEEVRESVDKIKSYNNKIITEVSGGINKSTISSYCLDGVDRISVGALTHSAVAVDLSLRVSALN